VRSSASGCVVVHAAAASRRPVASITEEIGWIRVGLYSLTSDLKSGLLFFSKENENVPQYIVECLVHMLFNVFVIYVLSLTEKFVGAISHVLCIKIKEERSRECH
jgi:hypothetical protein